MLNIFLDIKPTPKARPRFGKAGNVYTPDKTRAAETEVYALIKSHMNKNRIGMISGSVCVRLIFFYQYPRNLTDRQKTLRDVGMLYKTSKPDLDNLCKLVMDAMNGCVFEDDSQVCKIICEKRYSDVEGISVQVVKI